MSDNTPSRMRQLAEKYHAGELDREAFIEATLSFEWHRGRWVLPADQQGLNSAEKTSYYLSQIGEPVIPDSLDEFDALGDEELIDIPTKSLIYRRRQEIARERQRAEGAPGDS